MQEIEIYIKKKNENRPENIIKGIDPVSIGLLKQMYSALKDKRENLVLYEKAWVDEIEKIYSDQVTFNQYFIAGLEGLLKQAYNVLTNKNKTWDIKQEELLAITEKILFAKVRDHLYKEFYDEIELAIFSCIQLDFSKRIKLTKIGNSKENIFTYKAVILNTFIEAMENSVVSMRSVGEVLKHLPGTIVIITDKQRNIRYVNPLGEELLGNESLLKQSISDILPCLEIIDKESTSKDVKNKPFAFIAKGNLKISAKLNITLVQTTPIVQEFVYVIQIRQQKKIKPNFLIEQLMAKTIPVKTIMDGLEILSYKLIDGDSKKQLDLMKKAVISLQAITDAELKAIALSSANGIVKKKIKTV